MNTRQRKVFGGLLIAIAVACFAAAFVLLFFPAQVERVFEARSAVETPLSVRTDFDKDFWLFVTLIGGGTLSGIIGLTLFKPDI